MGWGEIVQIVHSFEFWVAVALIAIGIIIQKMIRPSLQKIADAFHSIFWHTKKVHDSHIDPTKPLDKKGHPILHSRDNIIRRLDSGDKKFDTIIEILQTKVCEEGCPVFKPMMDSLARREQDEHEFLNMIVSLRKQTQATIDEVKDSVTELHRRLDSFLESAAVISEKKDELIAKLITALQQERMDKNGRR